ncbi:MAG: magnesium transporter [Natrialbaceae archaeon]|nr:magnesium transporter [Natrialbaceae archaeon]
MTLREDSWRTRSIVRTMFPLLVVLTAIVLLAGITLEEAQDLLGEYGLLAIMVPTMINLGGNLGAILSSRLSTRFHLGTTTIDLRDRDFLADVGAILSLAFTLLVVLAVAAFGLGHLVNMVIPLPALLAITLVSGMAVAIATVPVSVAATYGSYRLGIDPDDVTIPIVTNVVDVFGMLIFIGTATFVLT